MGLCRTPKTAEKKVPEKGVHESVKSVAGGCIVISLLLLAHNILPPGSGRHTGPYAPGRHQGSAIPPGQGGGALSKGKNKVKIQQPEAGRQGDNAAIGSFQPDIQDCPGTAGGNLSRL